MSPARPPRPGDERRERFFRCRKRYPYGTLLAVGTRPWTTKMFRRGGSSFAGAVVEHEKTGVWLRVFGPMVLRIKGRNVRPRPRYR